MSCELCQINKRVNKTDNGTDNAEQSQQYSLVIWLPFNSQNIFGASQQNSIAQFSLTTGVDWSLPAYLIQLSGRCYLHPVKEEKNLCSYLAKRVGISHYKVDIQAWWCVAGINSVFFRSILDLGARTWLRLMSCMELLSVFYFLVLHSKQVSVNSVVQENAAMQCM